MLVNENSSPTHPSRRADFVDDQQACGLTFRVPCHWSSSRRLKLSRWLQRSVSKCRVEQNFDVTVLLPKVTGERVAAERSTDKHV